MLPEAFTYRDLFNKLRLVPCVLPFPLSLTPSSSASLVERRTDPAHSARTRTARRSKSATDIPAYVVEHADELRYLLPGEGNCIREDAPGRASSSRRRP